MKFYLWQELPIPNFTPMHLTLYLNILEAQKHMFLEVLCEHLKQRLLVSA